MLDNMSLKVKTVENGYILVDLTKDNKGKENNPKKFIAKDLNELKSTIGSLIEKYLG